MNRAQHGAGGVAVGTDATAADAEAAAPATGTADTPAPLTALTSLLGGTIEGGTTCTTDGSCD